MGSLNYASTHSLKELLVLIHNDDPIIRTAAVVALGYHNTDIKAINAVTKATNDSNENVREAAIQTLQGIRANSRINGIVEAVTTFYNRKLVNE